MTEKNILIIHTGGTFVMESNEQGQLTPGCYAIDYISKHIKPLFSAQIDQHQLFNLDSSLFRPVHWVKIAEHIAENYEKYDGFVVIHGTDTMAYTASALSFMLKNLGKPVVLTGAQLPLIDRRSDAFMNLVDAIEVAQHSDIPEVMLLFNHTVFRGNRTKKKNAWDFDAFYAPNYGPLLKLGIGIERKQYRIAPMPTGKFEIDTRFDESVIVIPFFPGIDFSAFTLMVNEKRVHALIIEAYGSGNIPSDNTGLDQLFSDAAANEIPIAVCSQSPVGKIDLSLYEAAAKAKFYGLISAVDMTREATLVKMMIALGRYKNINEIKDFMSKNCAGEKEN